MLTVQSMPQSLLPEVKTLFNLGRDQTNGIFKNWTEIATVIDSSNETEEMDAIGLAPLWRRWKSERQPGTFKEYKYRVKNYPWEHTIALDRRLVQFEKTGQIKQRATAAGSAFEQWISKKSWSTFRAGSSLVCYDGQYFFDTDHSWSGTAQSNLSTGNSPLDAVNLQAAMQLMMTYVDDQGVNLGVRPNLLIVGPQNEIPAWELTNSKASTVATYFKDNYFTGLKTITSPWIYGSSTQNEWYLVDTTKVGAKPVIHTRVTTNPEITEQGKDSYTGFWRNEYVYGGYYDGGFGVGDWFTALKNGLADASIATEVDPTEYYVG